MYEFRDTTDVVEEAGERFRRAHSQECPDLKEALVGLEESSGSGRVCLSDFYGSALNAGEVESTTSTMTDTADVKAFDHGQAATWKEPHLHVSVPMAQVCLTSGLVLGKTRQSLGAMPETS